MTARSVFHSSDAKDLQSIEAVIEFLNAGIVSISNICMSFLDAQVDPTTGTCSNYKQIREHIKTAELHLKKSEMLIKEKLGYLDNNMEQLTKEKGSVEQQKEEKCLAKDNLNMEKKSSEESLKDYKAALEQAKKNLESAKYALKVHQDRKRTGEGVAIAGAALIAIPFFGWVAGLIMICEGVCVIDHASKAISDAKHELEKNESQVNESSMKVSNYQSRTSSIQNKIEETDKVLNKIERDIEEVKQQLEFTAAFQEMVRRAVNLLSVLSGRVTVLERQTQCFILSQPVINAIKDVVKAAENVEENQLLYSEGVSGLINTLKENIEGLKPLCNSPKNSEDYSYY